MSIFAHTRYTYLDVFIRIVRNDRTTRQEGSAITLWCYVINLLTIVYMI